MIELAKAEDVVRAARTNLGLEASATIDGEYIAAGLRRLAGFLCPCSPKTLLGSMVESHRGLAGDDFADRVEEAIDALVAIGDLLELSDVTTLDETVKSTWLFAAPPSFVLRASGTAFLLGLAPDEATPVPVDLQRRLRTRGTTRTIDPSPGEDLETLLTGLGLRHLSMENWLRHPKQEAARALVASLDSLLDRQTRSGEVADLRVLDGRRPSRRYRARWCEPGTLNGRYIVRRPQAYGADLWGYAELANGAAVRLIDFPPAGSRWRGCDIAWRAQMAVDALSGDCQLYRRQASGDAVTIDLFSPIPDWARRRLAFVGEELEPESSLLSYRFSPAEAATEEQFLRDFLFLQSDPAWK
ncbi:hypothetical protein [Propylenella binzhouense]|uniref:Uncharacterized protein n=1 Tax=Propylenella binzhouense TaxID=2555902 RepID=A0A964T5L2_9HYPH|nr:hypothetical protein [Propylenella binzhouense]MYZ47877.1 hypothetical protein [Propylenella binzhouense]